MSPQMAGCDSFKVHEDKFKHAVNWALIDEAHLAGPGSGVFEAPYQRLASLRWRLKTDVVWAAVTATATRADARYISRLLGFADTHVHAWYSVDRPNIKYIPRFFRFPYSSGRWLDISYLVPFGMTEACQIRQTLIFTTCISTGNNIMTFLDSLIPENIPNRRELITTYTSLTSLCDRVEFKQRFEAGSTRVGIVSDTLTYGLNIAVDHVINIDTFSGPEVLSFPTLKQRIGRVGRDGKKATAVTYAPAWVQEVASTTKSTKQAQEDAERRKKLPGVIQQWYNPTEECCSRTADLSHHGEASPSPCDCQCATHNGNDETTADYAMVQRWVDFFALKDARSRASGVRSDSTFAPLPAHFITVLVEHIERWRAQKWNSIRVPGTMRCYTSVKFLPAHLVRHIASHAYQCSTYARFVIIAKDWDHLQEHGYALYEYTRSFMVQYMAVQADFSKQEAVPEREEASQSYAAPRLVLKLSNVPVQNTVLGKRALPETSAESPSKRRRRTGAHNENTAP